MRFRQWIWWLGVSCGTGALAGSDSPYDSIAGRNAFGLQPAPAMETSPAPPQAVWKPPPDLKITGLVAVPPTKKVTFYALEHGKEPRSYVLGEGEQQDDIKIVTIDGASQTVRVKNQGVFVVLDFKTHAL